MPYSLGDPVDNPFASAAPDSGGTPMTNYGLGEPVKTDPFQVSPNTGGGGFYDRLMDVAQGYHGDAATNLALAPDAAQWRFREMGEKGLNANEAVLRNPGTGEYSVYLRDPNVERMSTPVASQLQGLGEAVAPYLMPSEAGLSSIARPLSEKQALYRDYQSLDIPATPPAISPSGFPVLVSQGLIHMPFAGPPIRSTLKATSEGTAAAADRLAGEYGVASQGEQSGEAVQNAIGSFEKGEPAAGKTAEQIISEPTWMSSVNAQSKALYDRADSLVGQTTRIPLPNASKALLGPAGRFAEGEAATPEMGTLLADPKLLSMAKIVDKYGGMSVPQASELRSRIGYLIRNPGSRGEGIQEGDLKQVYGALTKDLRTNAEAYGPEAVQAADTASQYYAASSARLEQLRPLVSGTAANTFSKINSAATLGKGQNTSMLQSLQKSIPPNEWGDVGASILQNAGSKEGKFDPATFSANWKKISPEAKDALFGENAPGSNREALEALGRVAGSQQALGKLQGAGHGVERTVGGLGVVEVGRELWESGFSPKLVLGAIGAGVGANMTARLLMSPGFARWLYALPQAGRNAPSPGYMAQRIAGSLAMLGRGNSEIAGAGPAIARSLGLPFTDQTPVSP